MFILSKVQHYKIFLIGCYKNVSILKGERFIDVFFEWHLPHEECFPLLILCHMSLGHDRSSTVLQILKELILAFMMKSDCKVFTSRSTTSGDLVA